MLFKFERQPTKRAATVLKVKSKNLPLKEKPVRLRRFLRFIIFPVGRLRRPRPSASQRKSLGRRSLGQQGIPFRSFSTQ